MTRLALPGLLGAVLLLGGAGTSSPDLAGVWAFQTEPYHGGQCTLRGSMTLRPTATPNAYDCRLVAFETCPDYKVRAEQLCEARVVDGALQVASTVVEVSPPDNDFSYLPDNFALDDLSAERMEGELRSAAVAPVVFVRPDPAVS